jgi:hypothetical protein
MIARIHLGRSPSRLLSYLADAKPVDMKEDDAPRWTAVRSLGLGLDHADDWQDEAAATAEIFDLSTIAIRTLAAHRPDLKHRIIHLTLSVDPRWASGRSRVQVRRAYDQVLSSVRTEIGLVDRVGVAILHGDGHSNWRAHHPARTVEHLHAVVALPHPDTLRSISAHRLHDKAARACRDGWQQLNASSAFADATTSAAVTSTPEPGLDDVLRSISRQERERHRQRDRGLER